MPDKPQQQVTRSAKRSQDAHTRPTRKATEDERFAQAYLDLGLNITRAAREVWPDLAPATWSSKGSRMMAKKSVQEIITKIREREGEQFFDLRARALKRYEQIAFADVRELLTETGALKPPHEMPDEHAVILAGLKIREERDSDGNKIADIVEIKAKDQLHALDSISKTLGAFVERRELTGAGGTEPITVVLKQFTDPPKPGEKI